MEPARLQTWLRVQAVWWTAWLLAAPWAGGLEPVAWWRGVLLGAMALSHASLVVVLRAGRRAADVVTLVRFAVLLAAAWLEERGWPWFWAVAVVAVLLDLVDGAVARRWGGSAAGAVLDMETDQLTVLGLAALVTARGGGDHVLLLPLLRCLFVLAMWWAGAPAHDPKPVHGDNRRGRRVCASVMVVLLLAIWPPMPVLVGDALTAGAVLLLAWSFAGDATFLLAHRRSARGKA
ncbi:MAG: CDP-alcohol phosphatidyltransferase family protein [Planctomycetes bacterium]|nr:CDP-alcohol phosphatidyltransferase family protein [Planctomycetota bacterium]